jgi:tripartite-type tricarboxylate transporter receptor subunit TctC
MIRRFLPLACLLLLAAALPAWADDYPSKPIRFIVPFPAGGGNDAMARLVGQKLSERLGKQVVIDNRGGAGGGIGMEAAARSAPDGYTLLLGHSGTLAINPALYRKLPYDPVADFTPVGLVASVPLLLLAHPSLPANSVVELIALAKQQPGKIDFASSGNGTGAHLAGELFKSMAGVDLVHVPYKGSAPALNDLLGGHVRLSFSVIPPALPHVKAGSLKALAVTGSRRSPTTPETPTIAETVPGYETVLSYGVLAPAGTPGEIVTRLNRTITEIVGTEEVKERLLADGADPMTGTPEEFGAAIRAEIAKWAKVVKDSGAQID